MQAAMKSGDKLRLETLRMMKSRLLYVNARGELSEAEIIKILTKYSKDLKEAIEEFKKVGRADAAEKTEKELAIVQEYLPKELSDEELLSLVRQVKDELAATGLKDLGKMMKEILARQPGIDGAKVKNIVASLLTAGPPSPA